MGSHRSRHAGRAGAAWEALYDRVKLAAGQSVLIQGGAGGVGHMAVQLAALRGARVAATVRTDAKADLAASLGAEYIIRFRDEDVAASLRAWSGKDGADVGGVRPEKDPGPYSVDWLIIPIFEVALPDGAFRKDLFGEAVSYYTLVTRAFGFSYCSANEVEIFSSMLVAIPLRWLVLKNGHLRIHQSLGPRLL